VSTDPYRAGLEIGRGLSDIDPEMVFLFSTIHVGASAELLEGIFEVLDAGRTVLLGCTGDGFYELGRVAEVGVSALGLNSGGEVRWRIECEEGVGADPHGATSRCMTRLRDACTSPAPAFCFVATDFRTDTSEIVRAAREHTFAPFVGGTAGDDLLFQRSFVHAGHRAIEDAVVMVAADGPLALDIRLSHNLEAVGKRAVVTESEGTAVRLLDGVPAMTFIERELGKTLDVVDQGIVTLKVTESEEGNGHQIRSILLPDQRMEDTSVRVFGGVEAGMFAQVCLATPEGIMTDVREVGASMAELAFTPVAALMVSCAGRKRVLGDDIRDEVGEIVRSLPTLEGLAGFPSYGEFGPSHSAAGLSTPAFHNMTFVLLLLGTANA
jgi:hypothetical protein